MSDGPDYFDRVNPDLLKLVPAGAQAVLEIGCGAGAFGSAVKATRPDCRVTGVELHGPAADRAGERLDQLIAGSIEDPGVQQQLGDHAFDTLVAGDVLEHLIDPWATLAALDRCLKPGAQILVCLPNVQHWSMVDRTLSGLWVYQDEGLMDRTHLRWFSRTTALMLLRGVGWEPVNVVGRIIDPPRTAAAVERLLPAAVALGLEPEGARRDLTAFQWIFQAVKPV